MPIPDTATASEASEFPDHSPRTVSSPVRREVVLFGGLRSVPVPSMERYAESLLSELPGVGWPARLVRGDAITAVGPGVVKYAALEFSRHVLYPRAARQERADVYHITDHSFGQIVNVLPPERTVVTCHDLMPWMCEIYIGRIRRAIGLSLYERSVRSMASAAHVICVSTRTMTDVTERLGVDASRISVIPNGVGDAFSAFSAALRNEARRRLGWADSVCVVLHTGSAAAYKNVEAVIRSVAQLRKSGIDCLFAKVGPLTDAQQALIAELGLQESLRQFTGVADDVLCAIYNAADVMLFPSLYEGFGLPALEAMKAGLPVVISNAEALVEATGGHLPAVDARDIRGLAEAVAAVWEHRDARETDTAAARQYAEAFTWKRTAAATARVYERLGI